MQTNIEVKILLREIVCWNLSNFLEQNRSFLSANQSFESILAGSGWERQITRKFLNSLEYFNLIRKEVIEGRDWYARSDNLAEATHFSKFHNIRNWSDPSHLDKLLREYLPTAFEQSPELTRYYTLVVNNFLRSDVLNLALSTGKSQTKLALGVTTDQIFDHYSSQSCLLQIYVEAFAQMNAQDNRALFKNLKAVGPKIVDIGAASGSTAFALANSQSDVTLYDVPGAEDCLSGIRKRLAGQTPFRVAKGSFFEDPVEGGYQGLEGKFDELILGWILHDWNDSKCIEILKRAKNHLSESGRVLVLEAIHDQKNKDVNWLSVVELVIHLMAEGYERSLAEYEALFFRAGLKVKAIHRLESGRSLFELRRQAP